MKLEEVQAQLQADQEAREAEAAEENKQEETRIILKLAEIGVLAVDGWTIVSQYPIRPVISVMHPQLPNTVHVVMDYDYSYPYRVYIVGEDPLYTTYSLDCIDDLVALMSRDKIQPRKVKPELICPQISLPDGEYRCITDGCAWWSAHFHKCARAVLPSNGNR